MSDIHALRTLMYDTSSCCPPYFLPGSMPLCIAVSFGVNVHPVVFESCAWLTHFDHVFVLDLFSWSFSHKYYLRLHLDVFSDLLCWSSYNWFMVGWQRTSCSQSWTTVLHGLQNFYISPEFCVIPYCGRWLVVSSVDTEPFFKYLPILSPQRQNLSLQFESILFGFWSQWFRFQITFQTEWHFILFIFVVWSNILFILDDYRDYWTFCALRGRRLRTSYNPIIIQNVLSLLNK